MKTSHVYRTINGLNLEADVYAPAGAPRSFFVWFHGGALIMGSKTDVPGDLLELVLDASSLLISIGYRLAPQATVSDIAADAGTAWRWAMEEAQRRGCASSSGLVGGLSAGGYLALLTGTRAPRPIAVVSYYGYGTLDSPWYSEPSDHYQRTWRAVTRDEALAAVAGPTTIEGSDRPLGVDFYMYCRQNGLWPQLAAGTADPDLLRQHSPTYLVDSKYPPTLLLHGTDDHDVPHAESAAFAAMLQLHEVQHEFISLPGFDHGLVPGDSPEMIRASQVATEQAVRFIRRHLGLASEADG
jgi:acetyl esterase/lipase